MAPMTWRSHFWNVARRAAYGTAMTAVLLCGLLVAALIARTRQGSRRRQ